MADELVKSQRKVGVDAAGNPILEDFWWITVATAVKMSKDPDAPNIQQYINDKIADVIGGADTDYDTLAKIQDSITSTVARIAELEMIKGGPPSWTDKVAVNAKTPTNQQITDQVATIRLGNFSVGGYTDIVTT